MVVIPQGCVSNTREASNRPGGCFLDSHLEHASIHGPYATSSIDCKGYIFIIINDYVACDVFDWLRDCSCITLRYWSAASFRVYILF